MESLNYKILCDNILDISREAGNAKLKIYKNKDLGVTYKDDKTPLTLADKASNDVIEHSLKKLHLIFPFYLKREKA